MSRFTESYKNFRLVYGDKYQKRYFSLIIEELGKVRGKQKIERIEREGKIIITSTPKGVNKFYEMYQKHIICQQ